MILIIIPTLNRPGKLRALAENARDATKSDNRVLFVVEAEDEASYAETTLLCDEGLAALVVNNHTHCYAGAINAGYEAAVNAGVSFTHFLTGADDILFHSSWDVPALAMFAAHPELGVVGTNDLHEPGCLAGKWASHCLVSRCYIDETGGVIDQPPGVVLYEAYLHGGCLSEFHHTFWLREVWAPCLDSKVEHCHPLYGRGEPDAGYDKQPQSHDADTATFNYRRHLWSGAV